MKLRRTIFSKREIVGGPEPSLGAIWRRMALAVVGFLAVLATPAQAHVFLFAAPQSVVIAASAPLTSTCLQFIYDKNGNRLSSAAAALDTGVAQWGAATFGCDTWG